MRCCAARRRDEQRTALVRLIVMYICKGRGKCAIEVSCNVQSAAEKANFGPHTIHRFASSISSPTLAPTPPDCLNRDATATRLTGSSRFSVGQEAYRVAVVDFSPSAPRPPLLDLGLRLSVFDLIAGRPGCVYFGAQVQGISLDELDARFVRLADRYSPEAEYP